MPKRRLKPAVTLFYLYYGNLVLVVAAGFLHDLTKGQPDHARVGAGILEDLGYGRVAPIVGSHTNIRAEELAVDESGLLYLTDKFLAGERLVSLEERFSRALRKFAHHPEVLTAVVGRLKDARFIKKCLEDLLGISLEELLLRHEGSLGQVAATGPRAIYLARHGAVEIPGNKRRYLGHLDVPLNAAGRSQALALRERLREFPLSAIFCGDLQRARETAEIIAEAHGLTPNARREFREISLGSWEGFPFDEVKERFPEEYAARGRDFSHFRPQGGEDFLDCAHRVLPALFEAQISAPGDLLIVGHAGVNRILLSLAHGRSLETLFKIPQEYGCLNLMTYCESGFAIKSLHQTIHP